MNRPFFILLAIALSGPLAAAGLQDPQKPTPEDARFFETRVRPILANHCYRCHASDKPKSDFRIDSLAGMLRGGKHGPAIVPGKAKESLLILAINHGEILQMPPKKKISPKQITDLTTWVDKGAPWPNAGRDFRLTDVYGNVVHDIIA